MTDLRRHVVWEADASSETLRFIWNPANSLVRVVLVHSTQSGVWGTDETCELEGFHLDQTQPPTVGEVEAAIAVYLESFNGLPED